MTGVQTCALPILRSLEVAPTACPGSPPPARRWFKKYLETNDNKNTTIQKPMGAAKAVLRGKFIAIQSYLNKQETSQTNNLTLHLKQLERKEQKQPRVSRRKENIKTRSEINEKEMKETVAKINKTKSWFFEKINKIDKPLARLIKKKREKTQINRFKIGRAHV